MEFHRQGTGLQLRSLVKSTGELELTLVRAPIPEPGPDEVLIRLEATPINPSDLGLLLGAVDMDMSTARVSGAAADAVVTASAESPRVSGRQLTLKPLPRLFIQILTSIA